MKAVFQPGSGITVLVSDEDWDLAIKYQWRLAKGYPVTKFEGEFLSLHILVAKRMGLDGEIDHEDRNKLNAQRDNLRLATRSQNQANRTFQSNNALAIKGVSFDESRNKYRATIQVAGRSINLGRFETLAEAQAVYAAAAKKFFGDFASD